MTVVVGAFLIIRSGSGTAESAPAETTVSARAAPNTPVSPELVRHANGDRVIALTFDDGPHPVYTEQVLRLLAEYHAKATFCMIGSQAARFPELVRQVVDEGMLLCNHTVHHDLNLANSPEPAMEREVLGGREDIRAAAGEDVPIPYFRSPGGFWSPRLQRVAARNGMRSLSWSVDSHDWQRPGAAQIVASVTREVQPGAVILLHDGGGRREQTIQALAQLLPWFVERGYRFDFPR
jgi:peptidoglycan-N-acetylglucosamine deacetylase